jgi:hypothetical protein
MSSPFSNTAPARTTATRWERFRQPSCFGYTDHMIVPDGIARIRWSFARQDALGFVYKRSLTASIAVRDNAAIATVRPCPRANAQTSRPHMPRMDT